MSQRMKGRAGPSVTRIVGTEPGVLDTTQRSRLLRHPKATLSFAIFDPYVATRQEPSDISKLSIQEDRCRSRRIVIETIPGRGSSWCWVPAARKAEGVIDEGVFPRLIVICGQICNCSQEQWDIYKLDPIYDCLVQQPPAFTIVSVKDPIEASLPNHSATRSNFYEGEHGSMPVDDEGPGESKRHSHHEMAPNVSSTTEATKLKRPGEVEEQEYVAGDSSNRNSVLYVSKNQKRARTLSPDSGRRAVNAHRFKYESLKQARRREEMTLRREVRERHFLQQVIPNISEGNPRHHGSEYMPNIPENQAPEDLHGETPNEEQPTDSEDPVAASFRRMAELNADRERERQREKQLGTLQEARPHTRTNYFCADADRQRESEEAVRRRLKEEAWLREQEAAFLEEHKRKRAEVLSKVEQERRTRNDQWLYGPWTTARAIERYKTVSTFFDKARFSEETFPLVFIDIPWPTLHHPLHYRPDDVDWRSTSEFFNSLKLTLRGQAYRDFLKQSLQRFHPDRWSSRSLFASILDANERDDIITAVNVVSKALGALYDEARSSQ